MKYALRAVKYLVKIAVLLSLIFWLMQLSGTSNIASGGESIAGFFKAFIATSRGQIFLAALALWCAVYPAVEFKRRHLSYDLQVRKNAIAKALDAGRMTLSKESDEEMLFVGSPLRRILWLGEDTVTITRNPAGGIDIEGPRRFVMEAEHRIPNYVEAEKVNEQKD